MVERAGAEYMRLFPDKEINWDGENPLLKDEEFDAALKVLERLEYYAQNQESCKKYISFNFVRLSTIFDNSLFLVKSSFLRESNESRII